MILKRNYVLWLVLGLAFFVFSAGGCGGSDSDDDGTGPADWTVLAGTWEASEGYVMFFPDSGAVKFSLNSDKTESVDVTITGNSSSGYDVRFSEGAITFTSATGKTYDGSRERSFEYSDNSGLYKVIAGGKIRREGTEEGLSVSRVIKFVDEDTVQFTIKRKKADTSSSREAEITFIRKDSSTEE